MMIEILRYLERIEKQIQKSQEDTKEYISSEINKVNARIDDLENKNKQHSDHSLEESAKLGTTITDVRTLEDKVDVNTEALSAIVDELGLEGKVKLGRSTPPGVKITSKLSKISRENKSGIAASVVTTILLIVQIIWKIMEHH